MQRSLLTTTLLIVTHCTIITLSCSEDNNWGITLPLDGIFEVAKFFIAERKPDYLDLPCMENDLSLLYRVHEFCGNNLLPLKIIFSFNYTTVEPIIRLNAALLAKQIIRTSIPTPGVATSLIQQRLNILKRNLSSQTKLLCTIEPEQNHFLPMVLGTEIDGVYLKKMPVNETLEAIKYIGKYTKESQKEVTIITESNSSNDRTALYAQGAHVVVYDYNDMVTQEAQKKKFTKRAQL